MLLFRSEEHIDPWRRRWNLPFGATFSLGQCWLLAEAWYAGRLRPEWRRKTTEETEELFASLGLSSPFWKLQ
ncbi:MAG: hypothetical protein ACRD26_15930 [Vicinamibacterales bacterium]